MIVSQTIGLLSLFPWLVMAGLSFMAFDSGETTQAWLFVGTVWSYPLLPLGSAALAWILWAFKKRRAAVIITSLPLLLAVPLVIYLAFVLMSG